MKLDSALLDTLSAQAKANPRLRQAYDLRTTPEDNSQRILNAMEYGPETYRETVEALESYGSKVFGQKDSRTIAFEH